MSCALWVIWGYTMYCKEGHQWAASTCCCMVKLTSFPDKRFSSTASNMAEQAWSSEQSWSYTQGESQQIQLHYCSVACQKWNACFFNNECPSSNNNLASSSVTRFSKAWKLAFQHRISLLELMSYSCATALMLLGDSHASSVMSRSSCKFSLYGA